MALSVATKMSQRLAGKEFFGSRIENQGTAPRTTGGLVPLQAVLRTASKAASRTASKVQPKFNKGKKALTAGKDVKAQQFKIGLGKTSKTVALGFTKSNELFVGRIAMLGFAAGCIGEVVTGKGILAQLGFETGLPIQDLDGFVLALVAFNLIAALAPATGKFVPDEEELAPRSKGALQDANVTLVTPGKFFGVKGFGFTKQNELFVGRMAQLGFAAALIGEGITGKGPLAQLGLETGIPLNKAEPLLLFSIAFTLLAAINEGSGKFVEDDA